MNNLLNITIQQLNYSVSTVTFCCPLPLHVGLINATSVTRTYNHIHVNIHSLLLTAAETRQCRYRIPC